MLQMSFIKMKDSELIHALKYEVFEWAIDAALLSGSCKTKKEATVFYTKNILDVFRTFPDKQHCFQIQLDGHGVIGRAWLMERTFHEEGQTELRISYIKLDESYQRKGFASETFRRIGEYALKQNITLLSLNVFGHLSYAKRLYERLGFQVVEDRKIAGKSIATEMIKPLRS